MWQALTTGTIGTVVSDHSPCTPHLKDLETGDFMQAWGGISSVGLGLPVIWSEATTHYSSVTLCDIVRWMSANTAKQVGLAHCKGSIEVGKDADFCIFDSDITWQLDQTKLYFKNKLSPYHLRQIKGQVVETILGGSSIFTTKNGHSSEPLGKLILEKRST